MREHLRAALVMSLLVAPACRYVRNAPSPEGEGRPGPEERQRVLAFWQHLSAANGARLGRDCGAAVAHYTEALAIDPRHEDALYYLGQCLRELGRPVEARAAFERLVAANTDSARGHLALGALLASPDPAEPMDLGQSEAHLRRAHEINGEETGPMVRLGEVLLVSGRPGEGREWFEAALRTNPKCVEAAFLSAFVAWNEGTRDVSGLARRVRESAKIAVPVKGVLSEGDRKDPNRVAAPPLESPLGRLLFGAPVASLRGRAAVGQEIDDATVVALWREARRLATGLAERVADQEPAWPAAPRNSRGP